MFNKKNVPIQRKAILIGKEVEKGVIQAEKHIDAPKGNVSSIRSNIITIASTHKGAGCTHMSLSIAFELSKKYFVALVERDPTAELKGFDTVFELKKGNLNSKKLDNLDVYFYGSNELIDIIREKYDYIILDIGTILSATDDGKLVASEDITEVYRADAKILVTQTREWQLKYLADFIKYDKEMKDWLILANLSTEANYKELKKILRITKSEVLKVPYIDDVFNCSIEQILKVIR